MNKKKCPECSLVNWSEADICARCKSSFDTPSHYDKSGSKNFDAMAGVLKAQPPWLIGTLVLVIAAIGLITVYRITQTTTANASSNSNTNSLTPAPLGPEKDFAQWNTTWPNFDKIVEAERVSWQNKVGANDIIKPGGMIGAPAGQFSGQPGYVAPTYGKYCPGKVENAVLKGYRIFKVEDELLMMVEVEADVQMGNVNAGDRQCGTLINYGRQSAEMPYTWKSLGAYGEWVKRESGEPFGGAKTVEKERQKKLDEYNKFEADLKEKERKREARREMRRQDQAANQSSTY